MSGEADEDCEPVAKRARLDADPQTLSDAAEDQQPTQEPSEAHVRQESSHAANGEEPSGAAATLSDDVPAAAAAAVATVAEVSPTEVKITPGAYTQREEYLIRQEQEGEISFCYVENDGSPQNMIHLTGLKNIFSKQLPNMPKEYICRLVYDRRHKSAALCKRNGQVIGGITYRAFPQQGFGEIAFCAVTSSEQVKGFGTRLMNYAKEYARTRDRLTHFLTYADNNAVGYFSKQGFTKEVTLEKERWQGFIKDYDGGTLMECVMNPKICFTNFPELIRTQRIALDLRIRSISNAHVVRKGLEVFRHQHDPAHEEGEGKAGPRPVVDIGSIPGVREACWTPEQATAGRPRTLLVFARGEPAVEATPENLQRLLLLACKEMRAHDDSWPFREPVPLDEVPDYATIIKDPIDISLIERRLKAQNYYLTLDIFIADWRRMFSNCRTYNNSETIYYKLANKLETVFDNFLSAHVTTEAPMPASVGTPSQHA